MYTLYTAGEQGATGVSGYVYVPGEGRAPMKMPVNLDPGTFKALVESVKSLISEGRV